MRFTIISLLALPLALASQQHGSTSISSLLTARSVSCSGSDIVCGSTCIPEDYTCCPDKEGGCPADAKCQMGDNKEYGCCPDGDLCSGDGGSEFLDDKQGGSSTSSSDGSQTSDVSAKSNTNGAGAAGASLALVAVAGVAAFL